MHNTVYDAPVFSDRIFVFWCHQEVFDCFACSKVNLYDMLLTYVYETFTEAFCVCYCYDVPSDGRLALLSGPFLFLFLLLLDGAGALVFFLNLVKAQLGYLQEVSAFCRCSCSPSRCCLVEHTSLVLWNTVLMTLYLAVMAWWLSHCKY